MLGLNDEQREHVTRRLRDDEVIWLTTVRADYTPQPSPVWFLWDGDTFLMYSQPNKAKVRNIAARPLVALNLDSDGAGGDIVILTGEAWIDEQVPRADQHPAYLEKYRAGIANLGATIEQFGATYSVALRVRPTQVRVY